MLCKIKSFETQFKKKIKKKKLIKSLEGINSIVDTNLIVQDSKIIFISKLSWNHSPNIVSLKETIIKNQE